MSKKPMPSGAVYRCCEKYGTTCDNCPACAASRSYWRSHRCTPKRCPCKVGWYAPKEAA